MNKKGTNIGAPHCAMDNCDCCEYEGGYMCTGCRSIFYFGEKHQKVHWRIQHRDAFKRINEMRRRLEENDKEIERLKAIQKKSIEKLKIEERNFCFS